MSGRKSQELEGITLLGNQKTKYPDDYAPEVLETFENKHPENDYFVKFNAPEFTSLCPITGQPDFATIIISYVPDERLVESKSLKLYLFSFRNHGDFHEDVINIIMKDLIQLLEPKYIEVWGNFLPRGGLSIDPYCNYGKPGTKWEQVAWNRMSNHDMFPEHIEAQPFCEADIIDKGLIAGSSHQSVGPVALIQDPVEKIGLVIQTKTQNYEKN